MIQSKLPVILNSWCNILFTLDDESLWRRLYRIENKRIADEEQKIRKHKKSIEYGTNAAKLRLAQKKKNEMKEYRDNLENLTSKLIANLSSSVAAYNLKIMLKKRWIENTKNYKILSHTIILH